MSVQGLPIEAMYEVVINHEEQYSLWPAEKTIPNGWRAAGKRDTQAACLEFIRENWTDMTPLSVRQQKTAAT